MLPMHGVRSHPRKGSLGRSELNILIIQSDRPDHHCAGGGWKGEGKKIAAPDFCREAWPGEAK